mmetsp:Transcript_17377/g.47432  ORF Transcript_17377/g.47432 Transcript_17377/m.47432 type:complete len:403 (-) Transcript_17377:1482-2690(-)
MIMKKMKKKAHRQHHGQHQSRLYFLFGLALVWNLYFSTLTAATHTTTTKVSAPLVQQTKPAVTFVIPSKLGLVPSKRRRSSRQDLQIPTLRDTLESLQNQTLPNWHAIVCVDAVTLLQHEKWSDNRQNTTSSSTNNHTIQEMIVAASSTHQREDPRIQFVPIVTSTQHRGSLANGAGELRNRAIQQGHAKADWIAFVDDDDTLHPKYVEYLGQRAGINQTQPSIVLFRMSDPHQLQPQRRILPPLCHETAAVARQVGISFAVRKSLFFTISDDEDAKNHEHHNKSKRIPLQYHHTGALAFTTNRWEDFHFLSEAQERGFPIDISNCIAYFVRHLPEAAWQFLPNWTFSTTLKDNSTEISNNNSNSNSIRSTGQSPPHKCQFRSAQVRMRPEPRFERLCATFE